MYCNCADVPMVGYRLFLLVTSLILGDLLRVSFFPPMIFILYSVNGETTAEKTLHDATLGMTVITVYGVEIVNVCTELLSFLLPYLEQEIRLVLECLHVSHCNDKCWKQSEIVLEDSVLICTPWSVLCSGLHIKVLYALDCQGVPTLKRDQLLVPFSPTKIDRARSCV